MSAVTHNKMDALEKVLRSLPDSVEGSGDVHHHFAHGAYVRELRVPKDQVVLGKIHRYENINMLIAGTALIVTSDGTQDKISAPHIFVSAAGVQKAVRTITDCVFVNVMATESTDLDEIEQEFTCKSYKELN